MYIIILQRLFLDFLLDVVYFPLWWYTAGLWRVLKWTGRQLQFANEYLAPGLWLRHVFTPMFGQYDWQGRLASIFVRIGNIIVRAVALFIWAIVMLMLLLLWLWFPLFLTFMLLRSGGII